MTLDIIKPKPVEEQEDLSNVDLPAIVAAGVNQGDIVDLHSCVEFVNTQIEPNISGDDVEGTFKAIVKEAKEMSAKADKLARDGMTTSEIEIELSGENNFTYSDIEAMKVEVYGSVDNWLAKMTEDEA
jgi:hypothetical protein